MQLISKKEAIQQGLSRYFTGKPCKYGHISERFVRTNNCCFCDKQKSKQYYQNNKEDQNKYRKQYYQNNEKQLKQYHKQYNKQYRQNNKKQFKQYYQNNKQYHKQWHQDNPHKRLEYSKIRNTRLEDAIPSWFEEDKIKLLYQKRDELNKQWGTNFEVDHIIPINPKDRSVCGLHCWSNLQLLDKSLNSSKGSTYQTDW